MGNGVRLGAHDCERAMHALLAGNPDAFVAAVGDDGTFAALPEHELFGQHEVLPGRSLIELVAPGDRVAVMQAWLRLKDMGATRVPVGLFDGGEAVAHFFDVSELHGCAGVVLLVAPGTSAGAPAPLADAPRPKLAVVHKDSVAVFTQVDDALCAMLGWSEQEILGERGLDFMHPDDQDHAVTMWMEMLVAPGRSSRFRARHRCADGSWLWLEVTNHNHLDDPSIATVLSEMLDVSEEMAALDAVRAREQLLGRLADLLPVGIVQLDAAGRIVYANDRLWDVLAAPRSDTFEGCLGRLARSDRRALLAGLSEVLATGRNFDLEVQSLLDGELVLRCSVALRPLTAEDGEVTGAVGCLADVTDSAKLRAELERRATTDHLTSCRNRSATLSSVEEAVRRGDATAVIFIDLDGFKAVNDRHGHTLGDRLLETAAQRIVHAVRAGDVVGRIGGDEFLVLCPEVASEEEAHAMAARIGAALDQPVHIDGAVVTTGASVGVATSRSGDGSATELIARADAAMYRAKRARSGRV